MQTCADLPLRIGPWQTFQHFHLSSISARVLRDEWAISVQLLPRVIIHIYPGWFPDTLPSSNHLGVAVLSSISSCAPRSTFTFTFRVLCITHVSYTQIHSLHNQQALKLSHSHCHGIFKSVFIKMPLILNVKIILIGPVHIAHQSINLDISAGLATPLPDLCCH